MSTPEIDYLCVGVCMDDPESGYCLGCGRPPLPLTYPEPVAKGLPSSPQLSSPAHELSTTAADLANA